MNNDPAAEKRAKMIQNSWPAVGFVDKQTMRDLGTACGVLHGSHAEATFRGRTRFM